MWSNETTLYVAPNELPKIFAFNRSDGTRNREKDIVTLSDLIVPNPKPILFAGIWSEGTTMWVVDWSKIHDENGMDTNPAPQEPGHGKVFAYSLLDDPETQDDEYGVRDKSKEFALDTIHNKSVRGVWSNGTTFWVSDHLLDKLIAYHLKDDPDTVDENEFGTRDEAKDITLHSDNDAPQGIWSDGTTIWVADWDDDKFYAYVLATHARAESKEFDLHADNAYPRDAWSDGATMWVPDALGRKLYSYDMMGPIEVMAAFESSTYTVAEGGTVDVKVTLSKDPERTVVIPIAATNQDGAMDADYTVAPTSVTFNSGETEKSVTFTVTQDTEDDDGESVKLTFGSRPTGVSEGTIKEAVVSITDDDVPAVSVSFEQSSYTVAEGNNVMVKVILSDDPERTVVIPIATANQDGATDGDYTVAPTSVTFNSGEREKSLTFTAIQDTDDDPGERQDCDTAIWCATLKLADLSANDWGTMRLSYNPGEDPQDSRSSLSDTQFEFGSEVYQVMSIGIQPEGNPDIGPRPPSAIPENTALHIALARLVDDWPLPQIPKRHYRDWTLHIDDLELPFSEADSISTSSTFRWHRAAINDIFLDWNSSTTYQVWIGETPISNRPEPTVSAPTGPRYLRVDPFDRALLVKWLEPISDGNSAVTGYRVEWKPASYNWSDEETVEEAISSRPGAKSQSHFVRGATNGIAYDVRVTAINEEGESNPSNEHMGRPQSHTPRITLNLVNGATLTLAYNRALDATSVPDINQFRVIVNNGLRSVDDVAISGKSVTLTLASPVNAADIVKMRYVMPVNAAAAAIKDTNGNYAVTCDFGQDCGEAQNDTDPAGLQPLGAQFEQITTSHSGPNSEIVFFVRFTEPVVVDLGSARSYLLEIDGGKVTSAYWLNRDTRLWKIVVEPNTHGSITVTVPSNRACDTRGAPCASGERRLAIRLEHTITGTGS